MSMSRLNLILLPSMLALALPSLAAADAKSAQSRPLNLSLPRDVLHTPGNHQVDETVERNLRAPQPPQDSTQAPPPLPYGAGYEHRHREIDNGAGAGAGAGAGSGGGAGRRGR